MSSNQEARDVLMLHHNRMFSYSPSSVMAMAQCPGTPMLAVAYESGDVELWDMQKQAMLQVFSYILHL